MKFPRTLNKRIIFERLAAIIVFSIFFVVGITSYDNYGVHWDEDNNQAFGAKWLMYIEKSIEYGFPLKLNFDDVGSWENRDFNIIPGSDPPTVKIYGNHDTIHGPIVELALTILSAKLFHLKDFKEIIQLRHLSLFLLFYISVILFFFLTINIFNLRGMGILAAFLLVLHPRIFSHAFYNTVDIAFLSFYIFSTYTLIVFIEKKTFFTAFFHAIVCSCLINIRIAGIIVPLCTFIFLGGDFLLESKKNQIFRLSIFYFLILAVSIVALCPFLWSSPYHNMLKIITQSIYVKDDNPGWSYNVRWIILTTPIAYTLFFFIGLYSTFKSFINDPLKYFVTCKKELIIVSLFLIPIILPIILKSTLFDGWRHHYFVYPMFVLIGLIGVQQVINLAKNIEHPVGKNLVYFSPLAILACTFFYISIYIMKYSPNEHVYSNIFTYKNKSAVKVDNSIDYWGLSYRHLFEYILKKDKSDEISIGYYNEPALLNFNILPPAAQKKINLIGMNSLPEFYKKFKQLPFPKYLISNHREFGSFFEFKLILSTNRYEEFYSLIISGEKIATIYKLKSDITA